MVKAFFHYFSAERGSCDEKETDFSISEPFADTLAFTKAAEYTGDYIHMAKLTLVDGSPALVWAESAVETDNDVLMPQTSKIYTAKCESGTWQDKQLLTEIALPLYELIPSDGAEVLRVACLVDSDGKLTTTEDTKLRVGDRVLAENIRHIAYAKLPNESSAGFTWIRGGALCSEAGTQLSGVTGEYSVTEKAVFFSSSDANLSAYKYTDNAWSEAITLTEDERYLENLTALDTACGEIVVGMNTKATITKDSVTDKKNLVWSKVTAVNDLRIEYIDFEDDGALAGEDITVTVGVTNAGDHAVSSVLLTLDGVEQAVDCGTIAQGETAELTFTVACPAALSEYTVAINETEAADYTPEDNSTSFQLGCADLTVSASCMMLGGSREVDVLVSNKGIAPAGGILTLFDESGTALADSVIPRLNSGDGAVAAFRLDADAGGGTYYVEIVSDDAAEKVYNNSAIIGVPAREKRHELSAVTVAGDQVQFSALCEAENMKLFCAFYDGAGHMLHLVSETPEKGEQPYSIEIPQDARLCKLFLLDDNYVPVLDATLAEL